MEAQLKRGFLDMCILATLTSEDSYGYKIIKDAPESLELSESTLYPILRRLSKGGLLREYKAEHNGRLRKYYSITDEGRAQLRTFAQESPVIEDILTFIKKGAEQ